MGASPLYAAIYHSIGTTDDSQRHGERGLLAYTHTIVTGRENVEVNRACSRATVRRRAQFIKKIPLRLFAMDTGPADYCLTAPRLTSRRRTTSHDGRDNVEGTSHEDPFI